MSRFTFLLALFSSIFWVCAASASDQIQPIFGHCIDDANIPAEQIVSACTTYINEAYMQNYGLQYVPKALHSQALAYARLGKMKEAKLALGVAVKQAPDYFAAWKTLVEQQMGLTGIAANETAVDAMIKNSPNTYVLAKACIVRALDGQSTSVTMADCDEAVRLGPDRGFAFYARCFARYELADLANAVADCEAAMKLDPKDVTARYVAGLAKVKMGLTDAGNADIAAAKAAEPDITEPSTLGYPDWY